jgi:hypothetical protein
LRCILFGMQPNPLVHHEKTSYFGMTLSFLIIMLMVILAGLYVWNEEMKNNKNIVPFATITRPSAQENNEPESTTAEAEVETLGAMSTSDELGAIESDLVGTPFETEVFEASLQNIETELQ